MTKSRKRTRAAILHDLQQLEYEVDQLNVEAAALEADKRTVDAENARLKRELTKRTRVLVDLVAATIGNKS